MCDNTSVAQNAVIDLTKEQEAEEYPVQPKHERYLPNIPLSCMPEQMLAIPNSPQSEEEEQIPAIPQPEPVLEPIPYKRPEGQDPAPPKVIYHHFCPTGNVYSAVQKEEKTWFFKRKQIDLPALTAMCEGKKLFNLSPSQLTKYAKKAKLAGEEELCKQLVYLIHDKMESTYQFKPFTDEELAMIHQKKAQGLGYKDIAKLMDVEPTKIKAYFWSTRYNLPGFKDN